MEGGQVASETGRVGKAETVPAQSTAATGEAGTEEALAARGSTASAEAEDVAPRATVGASTEDAVTRTASSGGRLAVEQEEERRTLEGLLQATARTAENNDALVTEVQAHLGRDCAHDRAQGCTDPGALGPPAAAGDGARPAAGAAAGPVSEAAAPPATEWASAVDALAWAVDAGERAAAEGEQWRTVEGLLLATARTIDGNNELVTELQAHLDRVGRARAAEAEELYRARAAVGREAADDAAAAAPSAAAPAFLSEVPALAKWLPAGGFSAPAAAAAAARCAPAVPAPAAEGGGGGEAAASTIDLHALLAELAPETEALIAGLSERLAAADREREAAVRERDAALSERDALRAERTAATAAAAVSADAAAISGSEQAAAAAAGRVLEAELEALRRWTEGVVSGSLLEAARAEAARAAEELARAQGEARGYAARVAQLQGDMESSAANEEAVALVSGRDARTAAVMRGWARWKGGKADGQKADRPPDSSKAKSRGKGVRGRGGGRGWRTMRPAGYP